MCLRECERLVFCFTHVRVVGLYDNRTIKAFSGAGERDTHRRLSGQVLRPACITKM